MPDLRKGLKRLLALAILSLTLVSCTPSTQTQKLAFNNTAIYFTEQVSITEVQQLGKYLIQSEFANGSVKRVQLSKNEKTGTYIIKEVADIKRLHSETYRVKAKITAKQCSELIFNKAPVDFHYCNGNFKTLREIPFKS